MKGAISSLLLFAMVAQSAFACGAPLTVYRYVPQKELREGLVRQNGWHPLWMQEKLEWRDEPVQWNTIERYYIAEVADLDGPGKRLVLPDTGEIYSSVESLPKLKEWQTLVSAYRVVRFRVHDKVFAYGLEVTDSATRTCGPNNRQQRNTYYWDRKHGNNYCEELRPVKLRRTEEEPPPPVKSSAGVIGCASAPLSEGTVGWRVYPSLRPSIIVSDQDGDGVFERLDVMGNPPLPDWARTYAHVNSKIVLGPYRTPVPFTPKILMPHTASGAGTLGSQMPWPEKQVPHPSPTGVGRPECPREARS